MPFIPLKQTVKIYKKTNVSDGWGGLIDAEPITVRCRFVEESRTLENIGNEQVVREIRNQEVVTKAKIFVGRGVEISPSDVIEYTDEFGKSKKYIPKVIKPVRHLSGKVLYYVVEV